MARELSKLPSLFALCVKTDASTTPTAEVRPDMQAVFDEFQAIFRTPDSLPLARKIDYHINLREGAEPVNVHPHRYAYF